VARLELVVRWLCSVEGTAVLVMDPNQQLKIGVCDGVGGEPGKET
jgi:hypothetical protein